MRNTTLSPRDLKTIRFFTRKARLQTRVAIRRILSGQANDARYFATRAAAFGLNALLVRDNPGCYPHRNERDERVAR